MSIKAKSYSWFLSLSGHGRIPRKVINKLTDPIPHRALDFCTSFLILRPNPRDTRSGPSRHPNHNPLLDPRWRYKLHWIVCADDSTHLPERLVDNNVPNAPTYFRGGATVPRSSDDELAAADNNVRGVAVDGRGGSKAALVATSIVGAAQSLGEKGVGRGCGKVAENGDGALAGVSVRRGGVFG